MKKTAYMYIGASKTMQPSGAHALHMKCLLGLKADVRETRS